jgi:pimeloyl-ACP methyl ester carboxylesterase
MVIYAALGHDTAVADATAGLVTMASPIAFPAVTSGLLRSLGELFLTLPFPEQLPQHGVLVALWSVVGWMSSVTKVGMNPHNIDRAVFGRALGRFMCNVPRTMLRQLAQWSLSGEFRSCDGRVDYRANLSRITTPALIIAGTADRLAAPDMVRFGYESIGSSRKRYREFGLCHGDSADYGHIDLVFGRRAPEEVFPTMSAWIEDELAKR